MCCKEQSLLSRIQNLKKVQDMKNNSVLEKDFKTFMEVEE